MRRVSSAPIAGALVPEANQLDPLHRQLYNKLREQILGGQFSAGQQMPSTRVLAADLGLSRNTVLHAFEQLKVEGYLEGATGSGTYVARALPEQMLQARRVIPSKRTERSLARGWSRFGSQITGEGAKAIRPALFRPFQPGFPALDYFPFNTWMKLANRQRKADVGRLLGYGTARGYEPLRKAIASYLAVARGVRCEPEQVLIVSGTQQALDLTARLLLDPGDPVLVEEPSYRGAHAVFEAAGARLIPVPVDEHGMNLARISISSSKASRLVYTTPSHQFPLGTTMSIARRLEWVNWAAQSGVWILEDDYDSEFRYSSRPLPALQSLDRAGCVILLGTFSKVLFPALRLGYLVAPPDLVEGFVKAKAITDFHCPLLEQALLAEFMEEGHFSRHIRRMRTLYLERLDTMLGAIRDETEGSLDIERPDAGMHVLARLGAHMDDEVIARAAASVGVSCIPLSSCYIGPGKTSGLLLGYAGYRTQQIRLGVKKLCSVLNVQPHSRLRNRAINGFPVLKQQKTGSSISRLTSAQ